MARGIVNVGGRGKDANLIPTNIREGIAVYDIVGTLIPYDPNTMRHYATGIAVAANANTKLSFTTLENSIHDRGYITVSGLSFTPKVIKWVRAPIFDALNGYNFTGGMYSIYPFAGKTTTLVANVVCVYGGGSSADSINPYKMDNMYVTSSGFRVLVPAVHTSMTFDYEWVAWG